MLENRLMKKGMIRGTRENFGNDFPNNIFPSTLSLKAYNFSSKKPRMTRMTFSEWKFNGFSVNIKKVSKFA